MNLLEVYTTDILDEIEKQVKNMIPPLSIARNLELDTENFIDSLKNKEHPAYRKFWAGFGFLENSITSRISETKAEDVIASDLKLRELRKFRGLIELQLHA